MRYAERRDTTMWVGWFAKLLPSGRAGRALVLVALVDSIGTGFYLAGSAVFLTRGLGFSPAQVGLGIAVANGIGFALTVPLGMISDRIGPKRTLAVMYAWHALWMVALPFVTSLAWFTVVFTMVTIGDCGALAVSRALVSKAVGAEQRTRTLGFMRAWRNVGFTVGAALTAPLLLADTRAAYSVIILANAVAYVGAAVVVSRIRVVDDDVVEARRRSFRLVLPSALKDGPFLALTVLSGLLAIHVAFLQIALPIWVHNHTAAPVWVISALVVVNTVMAVALQVRFAEIGETAAAGRRALVMAAGAEGLFCLMVAGTGHVPAGVATVVLLVAVVVVTIGELSHAAGTWALSYRYAPADREGEYLAVFSLGDTLQDVAGPLLVTLLVLQHGATGWLGAAAILVALATSVRPLVAWLERSAVAQGAGGERSTEREQGGGRRGRGSYPGHAVRVGSPSR